MNVNFNISSSSNHLFFFTRIQTQATHMEWVIIFLANRKKQDNMYIHISYKWNTAYLDIAHVIQPIIV